jgi:exopolysaccharide biosynthesis polyprenyl glycosylphosphotransferase
MFGDRRYAYFSYLIVDILLIGLSFYLPYCLRYSRNLISINLPYFRDYWLLFFLWGLSLIFFLNNYRLYSTDRSLTIPKEIWQVIKCVVFASVLAVVAIFILQMEFFSRLVFGWAAILLILSLSFWRAIKRIFIRYRIAQGYYNINVLIVGAGRAGCALAEEIKDNSYLGLKVIGFLDDTKTGKVLANNILGKIKDLEHVVGQYFVDEIYVAIPSERKRVSEVLALGKRMKKTVRILADSFTFPFAQMKLNYIGRIPLIGYIDAGLHGTEMFIKRLLDVLVAGVGLILLTPLFAFIAFLIKLESPGPIFYNGLRCGRKGRLFNFYKFRSMVMGAENHKEALRHKSEVKGPIFKIKNDPRITRLGRLLRRYSLDELPQLINVLKGDMSLVGPRPPTPDELAKYDTWQMRRLDIKPGITCLWQVRGRSDLSFYKWMKWDLWYIDNWSFGLDLQILLWTIPTVLKRKGAY